MSRRLFRSRFQIAAPAARALTRPAAVTALGALALLLGGCAPPVAPAALGRPGAPAFQPAPDQVLHGNDFNGFAPLIQAMKGRVPGMRVGTGTACPGITFRNGREPSALASPLVYVDGTRTAGTCTLTTLPSGDVERVEIYRSGFTTRPGYARSSNGLILIFLKRG